MSSFEALPQTVAGSGEIVTVVYNAGSRPGLARKVIVVSLKQAILRKYLML